MRSIRLTTKIRKFIHPLRAFFGLALILVGFNNCTGFRALSPVTSNFSSTSNSPSSVLPSAPSGSTTGTGIIPNIVAQSIHPRVLLNPAKLQQIQSSLPRSATLQAYLSQTLKLADSFVQYGPPIPYSVGGQTAGYLMMPETGGLVASGFNLYYVLDAQKMPLSPHDGYYQVSAGQGNQNLLEAIGCAIENLAAAYAFTGETKYATALNTWALAVANYPDWDERFQGNPTTYPPDFTKYALVPGDNGPSLATGNLLLAMAVAYDWGFSVLPSSTLEAIQSSLLYHGRLIFLTGGPVVPGVLNSGYSWWRTDYMQNHNAAAFSGLAAAAAALRTENEAEMSSWTQLAIADLNNVQALLPSDGTTPEGISYGGFLISLLLKARSIISYNEGLDIFNDSTGNLLPFWKQAGTYTIYHITPPASWLSSNIFHGFGDVDPWPWNGPDTLLRSLASLGQQSAPQYLADQLDQGQNLAAANETLQMWEGLLDDDPNLTGTPASLAALPLFKVFNVYGEAVSRSDWTSPAGSMLFYRSGPVTGGQIPYASVGSPSNGSGHFTPANGSFFIFGGSAGPHGAGQELIRSSGYIGAKWTLYQNTLVFNCDPGQTNCGADGQPGGQIGQLGESGGLSGMILRQTQLSPAQICAYDPTAYGNAINSLAGKLGLTGLTTAALSTTCTSPAMKQVSSLCGSANPAAASVTLCQKTPILVTPPAQNLTLPEAEIGGVDYLVADATAAYDPVTTGMSRYLRHFVYLRNHNVLLAITDIRLNQSKTMNLYFHTTSIPSIDSASTAGAQLVDILSSGKAILPYFKMYFFDSLAAITTQPPLSAPTLQTVTLTATGSQWLNPAAFAWATSPTGTPTKVSYVFLPATATKAAEHRFTLTDPVGSVSTVTIQTDQQTVLME